MEGGVFSGFVFPASFTSGVDFYRHSGNNRLANFSTRHPVDIRMLVKLVYSSLPLPA